MISYSTKKHPSSCNQTPTSLLAIPRSGSKEISVSVVSDSSVSSPSPPGSGSDPLELSSSIGSPPGVVPEAVALFIIGVGFGQLQALTVSSIAPTSPGTMLSVPMRRLLFPFPSYNGFTINSSEVNVVVNPPAQAPNPAAARSSTTCISLMITLPKFSILNS